MFEVVCKFHLPKDSTWHDPGTALDALRPYAEWLGKHDPTLRHWYLGGDTLDEAQQYEAFADSPNGHTAAKAVVSAEFRGSRTPIIFLWNGEDSTKTGASLSLSVREGQYPSDITLALSGSVTKPRIGGYKETAEFVSQLVSTTDAQCCYVYHPTGYGKHIIYKDRPGVGWMLYLPLVLTARDIPEAEALVPVMKDKKQLGTIIVSVATDGVFDFRDPEQLRVARAIETRLVSNDWLPTWAQMMRM
jgi:Immunity protein 52